MSLPTRLLFIRHARSVWNEAGRWQGQADPPLSESGLAQAQRLAERLCRATAIEISHIYASDLQRAQGTATIIAAALGRPMTIDPVWRERAIGQLEGLTTDEIITRFPDAWASRHHGSMHAPGGESPDDVLRRAVSGCKAVLARHDGQTIAVVSHGGMILATLVHLLDFGPSGFMRLNGGNHTAISQVDIIDGLARLERLNDCAHLELP